MSTKTPASQLKAAKAHVNKALEDVRVLLSPNDQEAFEALQLLKAHYDDNRAKAVKEAIIAHAKQLGLKAD